MIDLLSYLTENCCRVMRPPAVLALAVPTPVRDLSEASGPAATLLSAG